MKYEKGEIVLKKISEDFKIKWVVCGTSNKFNNGEVEKINIEVINGNQKIDYNFYNSIMERKISDRLNLYKMPLDFLKFRNDIRIGVCKMWGGYDEDFNNKKIGNIKQFTQKRIYWLLSSVLIDFAGFYNFSECNLNFKDFCDNFGYDNTLREHELIYKKCLEMEEKFNSLNLSEESLKYLSEIVAQEDESFNKYIKLKIEEQY